MGVSGWGCGGGLSPHRRRMHGPACGHLPRAEDLVHLAAFGEFVDEFVEVADLFGEGGLDVLDAVAADEAGDQPGVGVELGLGEELREGRFLLDVLLDLRVGEAGEPADDLVEFVACAALLLDLGDIVGVDRGEGHLGDALVVFGGGVHGGGAWGWGAVCGEWGGWAGILS